MTKLLSTRFKYEPSRPLPSLAQTQASEAVRRKLVNGDYRLCSSDCPCAGPVSDIVISEVDRYGLPLTSVLCLACGTVRLSPYLDEQALEQFYFEHYQQMYGRVHDIADYLERQHAYGKKVLSVARPSLPVGGRIFEVGCGAGGALEIFSQAGYSVAGCDYSAELIAEARRHGVEAFYGTLNDLGSHFGPIRSDLIYLHHVFEHLNDPLGFLEICRRHLAPGGRLMLIVPDLSRIDRFSNPNGDLMHFLHIAHKYNFSLEGLTRLAARAGYVLTPLDPDPSLRTANSEMPEFWLELQVFEGKIVESEYDLNAGERMLRYLADTERSYERRQQRRWLVTQLGRLSPGKLIAKVRSTP